MEIKDSITKQELVDYVVNKKLEEVQSIKGELTSKLNEVRESIKGYSKDIVLEREKEAPKYIRKEYSPIIKLMEKKGYTHTIHINEQSVKSDLVSEIIYSSGNMVLEFNKVDRETFRGRRMRHPMEDIFDIGRNCESIIIIDRDEITSSTLEDLKECKESFIEEEERLEKLIKDCNSDINTIRNQRENIKCQIIENALTTSKDGKKMLEALNKINFGKLLTLGA